MEIVEIFNMLLILFIIICIIFIALAVICFLVECVTSIWRYLFCDRVYTPVYTPQIPQYSLIPQYIGESAKKVIAIDTESVGGPGGQPMLARVTLVRRDGKVFDKYVKPTSIVTDYRTPWSGIRSNDLVDAEDFWTIQMEVARNLHNCILVGHDLKHDLKSLKLTHPAEDIRDTSDYKPFRKMIADKIIKQEMARKWSNISHYDPFEMTLCHVQASAKADQLTSPKPKLKLLAAALLKRNIQEGEHNSIEDARAAMDLYLLVEDKWEASVANSSY